MRWSRVSTYLLPRRRMDGEVGCGWRENDAFLESLSVVAIIAVLAGVAVQSYQPLLEKVAVAEAANLVLGYRVNLAEHYAVTGELPAGIAPEEGWRHQAGRYFEQIGWRDQEIVFEPIREPSDRRGIRLLRIDTVPGTLSFPVATSTDGGRLIFLCGHESVPDGFGSPPVRHTSLPERYLPSFCRT